MMKLKTLEWDKELLKTLKVPKEILPEIRSSDAFFGVTRKCEVLPDNIPISGILGDQQAALFGQECFAVGEAKATYGTGAFLLLNTGSKIVRSKNALSTVAWKCREKTIYATETSVFIAGAAVQWLRDGLGLYQKSSDIEGLARSVPDSDGVFFIPALSGLGSPHWVSDAKGLIGGLTRRSTKAHVARATLDGIAYSVAEAFLGMQKDAKVKTKKIRVDGGAAENAQLMQFQSDIMQLTLEKPSDVESTARGAAYMAALGVGLIEDQKFLKGRNPVDRSYVKKMTPKEASSKMKAWGAAVQGLIKLSAEIRKYS
jgi:glycerol kinase